MCLTLSDTRKADFVKAYGKSGFIEVFKIIRIQNNKAVAPYMDVDYNLEKKNYISANGKPEIVHECRTARLYGGAIHVFTSKQEALRALIRKAWIRPCQDHHIVTAWAPLDAVIGVDASGDTAAFPYIILATDDWHYMQTLIGVDFKNTTEIKVL